VGNFLTNPLGSTLLSGGFNLLGAGLAAHGQTEAAKIQAKSFADALAYEKQRDEYLKNLESTRYADISHRLQPYQDMATTTGDRLAQLLGVNPASYSYGLPSGASPPPPSQPGWQNIPAGNVTVGAMQPTPPTRPGLDPTQPPVGTAVPRGTGLVNVRAPTGEIRQLDQQTAQMAVAKGAQIVG